MPLEQSQSLTTEFQSVQKDPLQSSIPLSASSNPVPADTSGGLAAVGTTTTVPNFNPNPRNGSFNVPEILWRNYSEDSLESGFNAVLTLNYDATNATNAFTVNTDSRLTKYIQEVEDLNWEIEGLFDVDSNGITDIFWRNYSTGENAVWFMTFNQNTGVEIDTSRTQFLDSVSDRSWEMEGVTNFDNAGGFEILWHNQTTGQTAIWGYNFDNNVSGQSALTRDANRTKLVGPVVSSDWRIEGWADFNNDQIADILWRNYNTGENAIWKLNTNVSGNNPYFNVVDGYFINSVADRDWEVLDVIDFNRDGVADIVWRNYRTGENAVWGMQSGGNFNPALTGFINSVPDINWELEGSADFTGDNIPDLLWRNYDTDENAIWRMKIENSRLVLDAGFFINSVEGLGWQIEGPSPTRDFT
ncbi:hypothetical protein NIES4071_84150 [Calothrix sp. NIES-4071]|nr:hypothetical protein NIES4071_84150 [Calothrix sp. NIES-4071]BAZ62683.1 hypothetical protein NIES4105_84080 [Calothrix sp. NIES-4105]